jgi:hypothetical protein
VEDNEWTGARLALAGTPTAVVGPFFSTSSQYMPSDSASEDRYFQVEAAVAIGATYAIPQELPLLT